MERIGTRLAVLLGALLVAACTTSPLGRSQLWLLPEAGAMLLMTGARRRGVQPRCS